MFSQLTRLLYRCTRVHRAATSVLRLTMFKQAEANIYTMLDFNFVHSMWEKLCGVI